MGTLRYLWNVQWRRGFRKGITYWKGWRNVFLWVFRMILCYIRLGMTPIQLDIYTSKRISFMMNRSIRIDKIKRIINGINK
jgi:hypothetical protein